jgi:hypothetical protein
MKKAIYILFLFVFIQASALKVYPKPISKMARWNQKIG